MRMHIATFVLSVSVLVLLSVVGTTASEPKELLVTFPQSVVGVAQHGNVLVVVNYQKNDRNRELDLMWESANTPDGDAGSSALEITAENDGVPFVEDLTLSRGEYVFVATLYRSDGTKVVDRQVRFVTNK